MINVKFYLDKADKNRLFPIHLVIRNKETQIKVSIGEKIKKKDWDNKNQRVKDTDYNSRYINKYITFLKDEALNYLETTAHNQHSDVKIKEKLLSLITGHKENTDVKIFAEDKVYYEGKNKVRFIDLFAGAGGFSEGFLQAEANNKYYDFLLASDINENCELTHLARYNHQLGLDMEFLKQDITEPDFLDNMLKKLDNKTVDVVCGGPPCQSFSLAGKRKKFDKKDDLFSHYLKVIRQLRPKYFVMENVKGILTKEGGKIKEMILQQIRSIVDLQEFHQILNFVSNLKRLETNNQFLLECYSLRLQFERVTEKELEKLQEKYILNIENKFRQLTPKIVDYKTSKTDINISTIRHGFNLLKRTTELAYIRKKVINEKAFCDVDNDHFANSFDDFLTSIESESIIDRINLAFASLKPAEQYRNEVNEIIKSIEIYDYSFDECVNDLREYAKRGNKESEFNYILSQTRLYNIDEPFVALASNYGVPQNRERVLFIGCRKDQKPIKEIPATVSENEKVTVFEALYDLDFIENDEVKFDYEEVNVRAKFNGSSEKLLGLLQKRTVDGIPKDEGGFTYAEWSKNGRLNGRFANSKHPFYVRDHEELNLSLSHLVAPLHNHKTSKQNEDVIKRLDVILNEGDYQLSKSRLKELGLESDKRNYNVLKPTGQSPTVMTISDDYIHYANPRALTVREMARLQSFDDSFVFQGKRSTGGNKRKYEVPQFTLVGNAVPPLMARAAAMEILKNIS
ncbi:DNA (cytosine-5-)-methyltransferase [Mucilaginibacter sp. E4BP6]|uniref:DNA (cytosine-5-)-methyltransferase n=1 Tax=Mucilaginibacter sp. E4BP6 TaxID=2723089 RepID=UPI0015CE7537|nr:DNA (cytosine-5-)-methyltransferase [Mucilaginibacter sp. E4BP6]NYE68322.1 DNA (cytosine-5)-methyltransferase 1 [Mucilaginibacter sp. E4BP6]